MEKKSVINGWLIGTRKLGKIMFLLIRQSEGKTIQAVVKDIEKIQFFSKSLENGDFIRVEGFQKKKNQPKKNTEKSKKEYLKSEVLEIDITKLKIVNKSCNLPFELKDDLEIKEDNRYKYRYLDLRRKRSIEPIILKSKIISHFRKILNSKNFFEIDTPILSQFSPEGAKTFVVPSNTKGKFYTLPQSPQIFKQILMISGFSKYYQIAKNFRNEDLRKDRQPEFLQLDIETWMASEKSIFNLVKSMLEKFLIKSIGLSREKVTFEKISFKECIKKYGSDKPDLRNPIEIRETKNKRIEKYLFFNKKIEVGNFQVKAIEDIVEEEKIINVFFFEKRNEKIELNNFFGREKDKEIKENLYLKDFLSTIKESGNYVFLRAEEKENFSSTITGILGKIRSVFDSNFKGEQIYKFLWINNWPLFQKEPNGNKFSSFRHPFTMPKKKYLNSILKKKNPKLEKVKCEAYDLVCNGEEIASGSIRINDWFLQKKVFELIGFNKEQIEKYFGYFLKALSFAAPPHGGIAIGIERLVLVLLDLKNLKETIAFPKNTDGTCSLTGAPDFIL